ncbi:calcium/sodium antiporter [Mangrovicoccus algicola]|uniref:Calcium/sodium antiporter n=1 Tax=Mangrovicoccus algicola TaxID=2771008 RepID=A0A8J6YY74_9RHOB|nr:calcium/sodium antiporter [Mangrovicoccus algicola]MBE3638764.1 calcium/sodium antiporter [Mangrovicoccus algicola]
MTEIWLPLLGGLVLLILGGDLLVRGAVRVAGALGVPPLVIGLTLVGFGTSTPELVTSLQAALSGAPGIAFGNIVGSNIANILLIGGVAALICPIAVESVALRRDGMAMLGAALAFAAMAWVLPPGRLAGFAGIALLCAYLYAAFRHEAAAPADHGAAKDKELALEGADPATRPGRGGTLWLNLGIALGGLVLVVLGGKFLVDGAVSLARGMGISETVIGLTIVAVGTSMPELVTSVIAGLKRQGEVAFGNIVGSNIYNILGIGGTTLAVVPGPVPPEMLRLDLPVMVAVSLLFVVLARTGWRLSRPEGLVLLAGYGAYLWAVWP